MDKKRTLKILKELRLYYRISFFLPFYTVKWLLSTEAGICRCLKYMIKGNSITQLEYYNILSLLSVEHGDKNHLNFIISYYWYPAGKIKPRLKLINRLIKNVKTTKEEI